MKAPTQAALALAILAVAASGCSSRSSVKHSNDPAISRPAASLEVVNSHWNDVRVFAVRGSAKHRLGVVTSMGSGRFKLPEYLYKVSGHVTLRVEPIGSNEAFESMPIPAEPGGHIEWRIRKILYQSSAMVY